VDARVATLGAQHTRPGRKVIGFTLSRASLNRDARLPGFAGRRPVLEPVRNRTLWTASVEHSRPLAGGTFRLEADWTQEPLPAGADRERVTMVVSWKRNWHW